MSEVLAAELAGVLTRMDRVPAMLVEAARAALRWRDPDAALAALVAEEFTAPAVRGAPPRLLSFTVDAVTIEVEVSIGQEGRVRLLGQIGPVAAMPVEVRHTDGAWTGQTDPLGRFAADDLPAGPLRVFCTPPGTSGSVGTEVFTA